MATLRLNSFRSPNHIDHPGAAEASERQAYASAVAVASSETCSPLAKSVTTPNTSIRQRKKSQQLKCEFQDCTHEGTFPRKWELERHIKARHSVGSGSFVCRAEGCFDKQLPRAFTRSDKLTSHIKAVHTRDTVFTSCPVDRCDFGRCTLETLGVHIARAHKDWEAGRAVFNASPCKVRKCPLWRCGRHVKSRDLPGHVAKQHAKDDILAAIPELEHEGLVVLSTSDSSQQGHAQSGLDITVQCPVCNTTSDDVDGFIAHFWDCHLFLAGSGGADHFESWKSRLVEVTTKWDQHGRINGLPPWAHLDDFIVGFRDRMDNFQCSSCLLSFEGFRFDRTESQPAASKAISAHHLSLLRPEAEVIAELYPHRMQILRLYPEFASHPVFADLDKPQKNALPSSQERSQLADAEIMEDVQTHGHAMAGFNTPF